MITYNDRLRAVISVFKSHRKEAKNMFQNQRYLTAGVNAEIPLELQLFLWSCIDQLPSERDYLQVFQLEPMGQMQSMNGANHQMNAVSTFPFYTLEGWDMEPPAMADLPLKGDTVIGNDVWIGQNAVILPGVHIGDGAIIGASSVVGRNVEPYTIVVGNPAKVLRKRFDDELTKLLLRFKWWDKSIDEINELIPILTSSDLDKIRKELKNRL